METMAAAADVMAAWRRVWKSLLQLERLHVQVQKSGAVPVSQCLASFQWETGDDVQRFIKDKNSFALFGNAH